MVSFLSLLAVMGFSQAQDLNDAGILVLDKNPLESIENTNTLRYVMKNGELFEAATFDQIWPVKKPLPKQFWWDDVPTPASTTHGGDP